MTHPDEDTYRLTDTSIPMLGDVFTQEALDGLIGQTASLTVGFERTDGLGKATIVKAEQHGDFLTLGITVDKGTMGRIERRFGKPEPEEYSIGFVPTQAVDATEEGRRFLSARIHEITTGLTGQFFPKPATPKDPE